ncbi:L,D-transpeptidase family protein [Streptomyces gamaensis]|uniref:L,D-transpeptidase family protein n=1 Tax=Streptomyces gamaensis TaxID=1763542 RepID=A0ABW0Z781_9ACTN
MHSVAARRLGVFLGALGLSAPLTVALDGTAQAAASGCTTRTGPYQKEVESFLGRPADGRQSPADCEAIRAFQHHHRISPEIGYAGPVTWGLMKRELRRDPDADGKCPVNKGRIACVDLTRQLSWIQDGGKVVHGPVHVRTGREGYGTRTGVRKIYWRSLDHFSTLYKVPMPYAQFFDGGQAFHAIDGSVWSAPGSHGCVNMRPEDARAYWSLLRDGDTVFVYGRKPGT